MIIAGKKRLLDLVASFPQSRILVIGDFILDRYVWGTVQRISPEAPVPVVNVDRESYMPGGSLNVANNIRTLGGTVYPCGVVGRDLEGRMLVKEMRRAGIDTGGVVVEPGRRTSLKTRVIAHSQQVVRYDRETTGEISRDRREKIFQFIQSKIRAVDVLIVEDYGKGMIQPAMLKRVIALAKRHKKPILVDPKEKHFSYYRGVTLITPNRKEAYGGLGETDTASLSVEQVGRKLIKKLSLESILVTLGEDGMMLMERSGRITSIPTAAREVYDVSGAGDTVIATCAMALACGAGIREAALLSNLAAGVVVGKLGTATLVRDEMKLAIQEAEERLGANGKIKKVKA